MNKKIFILLAVLAALALVFVACENEPVTEDTTVSTEAPTDAATEVPTETPTETPTDAATDAPTEAPTDAATDAPTEEVTTEEPTTEAPTEPEAPRYDDLSVPQDQWVISGHRNGIQDSSDPMVAAGGVASGALLHQGSISIGEHDLSKYSKAIIYFGMDGSDTTLGLHAANANNRIMLVSADMNLAMSPAEETVIASADYTPSGWAVSAVEIDLSEIDYNGALYVTYDTLEGTFMLVSEIILVGAVIPEGAEIPEQGGNETPEQGGNETPDAPETYTVDLSTVTATGSYPTVDVPVPGSLFSRDHCIALHYGSIALGEIDLSKYSKVTVTYATPGEDMIGAAAVEEYNKTAKRVMLLDTPSAAEGANGTFEYLPEESAIIASNQYERSPATLTLTTAEIDLTEVTYNGELYLTFDFRGADNAQVVNSYLIWLTDIVFS